MRRDVLGVSILATLIKSSISLKVVQMDKYLISWRRSANPVLKNIHSLMEIIAKSVLKRHFGIRHKRSVRNVFKGHNILSRRVNVSANQLCTKSRDPNASLAKPRNTSIQL